MSSPSSAPPRIEHESSSPGTHSETVDLHALFGEMQPALLRAARRWAPAEAVDDVVQDTWMGVLKGVDRFEGRSQVSTWVFGILWRQCGKQRRRVASRPFLDSKPGEIESRAPEIDPSRVVEGRDSLNRTFDAIEELPDRYREIILLRDVLDRPAAETCKRLDLSEANQRVLLSRARNQVRRALPDLSQSSHS